MDIDGYLNSIFCNANYLAHIPEKEDEKRAETLKEHSLLCMKYFNTIDKMKNIKDKVYHMLRECGCKKDSLSQVWNMFQDAVLFHDVGKINPAFQYKKMKNKLFKKQCEEQDRESDHSLLSSYIYLNEHMKEIDTEDEISKAPYLISFAYCISRHHGHLDRMDDFTDKLEKWMNNEVYPENLNLNRPIFAKRNKLLKVEIKNETAFFILARLLYSLIVVCDFYATSEYKSGKTVELEYTTPFPKVQEKYESSELYRSIVEYRKNGSIEKVDNINQLRSRMFLEAEDTLIRNIDNHIFYLEAPTGSGKTNTSINLFLKLTEQRPEYKNVFYIFPFNTLVEQTTNVLKEYVPSEVLSVMNSLTPIKINENDSSEDAYLNWMAMNYPVVVTSHVNLFDTLFGTTREQAFSLYQLCNSVIILDEIQSYRIGIWSEFIVFLSNYAELLNIKVIVMSATLPRLDQLLKHKIDVVNLIKDTDYYFQNPFFKERVIVDFSMANRKYSLEEIAEVVLKYKEKKVLIEFFKKSTAREFYRLISGLVQGDIKVVELTGDDNIYIRNHVLNEIRTLDSIIVIATQVIEAGIDIDMDIGFKDISIPDSDEQFLGRINRSCKKKGSRAFFFHYDDPAKIYQKNKQLDFRLNYAIDKEDYTGLFIDKNFTKIYEKVLNDIKAFRNQKNGHNIETLYDNCRNLNFNEIANCMKLMDSNNQIYLGHQIICENREIIDGNEVWEEYQQLCSDTELPYAEKKIKLSEVYSRMALFTFNIMLNESIEGCGDRFGSYIYIANGEEFMEDGKLDREKLKTYSKRLIL